MTVDLQRGFAADIEIRSDGTGRTIHGIVVPFGQVARVRDSTGPAYNESFQAGAFAKNLQERRSPVKLLSQHDPRNPIGRAVEMREDGAGLYGAFRVSNTQHANEQLELARDGVLDSFSVGFTGIKHVKRSDVVVRTEAVLKETSLVTFPAYEGAVVAGIRSLDELDAAVRTFLDQGWTPEQVAVALMGDPTTSLAERLDAVLARVGTPDGAAVENEPPARHSLIRIPKTLAALKAIGHPASVKETA